MTAQQLAETFKPGDIVFYFDKGNAEYQYSRPARMLHYAQSWFERGDISTVHVGLIVGLNPDPPLRGDTPMLIIDSMPSACFEGDSRGVNIRPLVRNYSIEVFRLKPGASDINSEVLAKTAVEIAKLFIGMDYSITTGIESWWHRHKRENKELNEFYTRYLIEAHLFDPSTKKLNPNIITHGMNCSESVITWYQLAILSLLDESACQEQLPDCVGLHAHSTPAKLHEFVAKSRYYKKIDAEPTRVLRFSGPPHPDDHSMAIIPYEPPPITPPTMTWGEWLYSILPSFPSIPPLTISTLWEMKAVIQAEPEALELHRIDRSHAYKFSEEDSTARTRNAPKVQR